MKKIYFIFILIAGINSAQNDSLKFRIYGESAIPVTAKTVKYSLFQNAEYGVNDKISIAAHPLMMFLSPSVSIKYNFHNTGKFIISSMHGINYPTPLMNLVKKKGTGGFISPEYEIPWLLSINNSVIVTYIIDEKNILTGELGFEFAVNNSKLKPGTSVDLPIVLARSMVFYKNAGFNFKIISEGNLLDRFDLQVKSELFLFPFSAGDYDYEYQATGNNLFWELTGNLFWNITETFKLGVGTKLCYGTYPFGKQWHLLPFIDFVKYCE